MKRLLLVAAGVIVASTAYVFAGATKVEICHVTGSEENPFEIISISDSAYDAHIAHGDADVNDDGSCGDGGGGGDPGPT